MFKQLCLGSAVNSKETRFLFMIVAHQKVDERVVIGNWTRMPRMIGFRDEKLLTSEPKVLSQTESGSRCRKRVSHVQNHLLTGTTQA
jgi:hypothetical protein